MWKTQICSWYASFSVRDQIFTIHIPPANTMPTYVSRYRRQANMFQRWGGGGLAIAKTLFHTYSDKQFSQSIIKIDTLETAGDVQLRTLMNISSIFQCRLSMHYNILPRMFIMHDVYLFSWVYMACCSASGLDINHSDYTRSDWVPWSTKFLHYISNAIRSLYDMANFTRASLQSTQPNFFVRSRYMFLTLSSRLFHIFPESLYYCTQKHFVVYHVMAAWGCSFWNTASVSAFTVWDYDNPR